MPTYFNGADDGDFITGDNAVAQQLLLRVNEFDKANSMGSYLRIGAVDSATVAAYAALYVPSKDEDNNAMPNAYMVNAAVSASFASDSNGEDLASKVLSFVDDERDRGNVGSDKFATLTPKKRRKKSSKLHTKGGWRDHTDGNRITTTRGDKVEVIRGNYKQQVLGRSQWKNDAGVGLHYESSGGITYHYDEVPGQIVDVRWVSDPYSGTWKVLEECEKGDFVALYSGNLKEWVVTGDQVDRIGSQNAYDNAYKTSGGADNFSSLDDADFTKPDNASHLPKVAWPSSASVDYLPNVREEVFANTITARTFAQSVKEQDGSETRPVDKIVSKRFATKTVDHDGSSSTPINEFNDNVYVDNIVETEVYDNYEQKMEGSSKETWECLFYERFGGAAATSKFGVFLDFRLGFLVVETNTTGAYGIVNISSNLLEFDAAIVNKTDALAAFMHFDVLCAASHTSIVVGNEVKMKAGVRWVVALSAFLF